MKNIESCTLAMMESPSPPSLKETDGSTNDEPLESPLKKIDSSSAEVDSTTKDPEENGHSEVKEKASSEDDAPVTNGTKALHENGKDNSETEKEENGLQTPKSPEQRPEPDKSLDSEISALVETIDTDMKDDSECNDSSSEDSDDKTKEKSTDNEVTETIPETEITSSSTKESAEKMDSSESEKEPAQKKNEICLEPASASSQSDSEDSEEEKSKTVESTDDKPDEETSIKPEEKAEPVKPEKDYKAALDELTSIAQNAKKINDDDLLGIKKAEAAGALKRTSTSTADLIEPKKMKLGDLEGKKEEDESMVKMDSKKPRDINKDIKNTLKTFTREQLEGMVTQKIAEVLSARSEISVLRRKCDSFEEECEKWKKKQQLAQKMCADLNTVMKRYITDEQSKQKDRVTPIKITRSVGLQVVTDRNRRSQQVGSQQVATKTQVTSTQVTNKSSTSSSSSSSSLAALKAVKPVTIATPTTMVVPRPAPPPKPVLTQATVKAPLNNSVAQNISKLPSSVSIIQTPSANTASSSPQASQQQQQQQPSSTTKKVIECVDLSDDEDQAPKPTSTSASSSPANGIRMVPVAQLRGNNAVMAPVKKAVAPMAQFNNIPNLTNVVRVARHPAPLPDPPRMQSNGPLPPKPTLKLSRLQTGIVLSWNMTKPGSQANIANYQIYAYQETNNVKPEALLWKKVGDVKALPLPMACTLTQFQKGNKYHFAVRAKDQHQRVGFFSEPQSIALT